MKCKNCSFSSVAPCYDGEVLCETCDVKRMLEFHGEKPLPGWVRKNYWLNEQMGFSQYKTFAEVLNALNGGKNFGEFLQACLKACREWNKEIVSAAEKTADAILEKAKNRGQTIWSGGRLWFDNETNEWKHTVQNCFDSTCRCQSHDTDSTQDLGIRSARRYAVESLVRIMEFYPPGTRGLSNVKNNNVPLYFVPFPWEEENWKIYLPEEKKYVKFSKEEILNLLGCAT